MSKLEKRKEYLPYALPFIEKDEINEVVHTLESGWVAKGPKTIEFEKKFAEFVGSKYAVATNSATAALHLALLCAGVKEGDEVITTPMTFASSANTIIHTGAKPVFVDVDPETFCIDPKKIEEKITSKTKAIVPVHYTGQACDMDAILEIAKKHNLFVSEDGAHAVYTQYNGKMVGSIGDATSFSFYATKNICTGEGGMLTTNREDIAEKAKILSSHGMSKAAWNRYGKGGAWRYDIEYPGFKYNMFDIQAAMGLRQLDKIEKMQKRREEIANMYNEAFKDMPEIITPKEASYSRHAWHLYVMQVNEDLLTIDRDKFIEELAEENIGTSVHFIPVHLMPYYSKTFGYKEGDFPVAEKYFNRIISLPLYVKMSNEDVEDVIYAVTRIVNKYKK
ncbi:UDP-4-amino-4-deoxy-L-arabinose--oxoglutarate aminotransferase [Clostridium acetireducens DSM 10703]|uniref:UDP-4-amino-4-deoxy-L-arabinose--oxoglutarate aminotransferase n=1 Tax=Clostridium acetireducens DSM 10703 TaxID=1121290 RepID=A0A1E8EY92_9CLOT|nr:DegT/DnrJ/EryC1/StrS aminotransferase family protein [Clostridium acetireducens]OFI05794.1 UDP-4-amino-4-deoxy-L-arabinose--oxoglutarate aminotransferase [Clostridium acetireducens DSM 10703]